MCAFAARDERAIRVHGDTLEGVNCTDVTVLPFTKP